MHELISALVQIDYLDNLIKLSFSREKCDRFRRIVNWILAASNLMGDEQCNINAWWCVCGTIVLSMEIVATDIFFSHTHVVARDFLGR